MSQSHSENSQALQPWVELLQNLSAGALNTTIGLIAGGRVPSERRVLDRLAQTGLENTAGEGLLIRLNMGSQGVSKRELRTARASDQAPTPTVSPLGKWKEVSVPMLMGQTAPKSLERLPRWLTAWKKDYRRILLDLGPLDEPVCRTLGRFCDCCLLLLGPETCASPTWLRKNIDHLTQCHASLTGSIVITADHQSVA